MDLLTQLGRSPLYVASQEGHLEVVNDLLEAGAQVSVCGGGGGRRAPWRIYRQCQLLGPGECLHSFIHSTAYNIM